jgi:hypothetical protein
MLSLNKIVQVAGTRKVLADGRTNAQLIIDLRYPIEAETKAITLDLKLRVDSAL